MQTRLTFTEHKKTPVYFNTEHKLTQNFNAFRIYSHAMLDLWPPDSVTSHPGQQPSSALSQPEKFPVTSDLGVPGHSFSFSVRMQNPFSSIEIIAYFDTFTSLAHTFTSVMLCLSDVISPYQLLTCRMVSPVSWDSCRFCSSEGYGCYGPQTSTITTLANRRVAVQQ